MTDNKTTAITFADTGITGANQEEVRDALTNGDVILIQKIEIRPSKKYGEFAAFDGENLDGEPKQWFTASGVLTAQAKLLLEKYGTGDGKLTSPILASVISVKSATGRFYLSFA